MFKRILAITTSAVTMLALTMAPACVFAASGNIEKDETVYVITDSTGSQNEVIVSDHLKNTDKVDQIEDKTNLSDIEKVCQAAPQTIVIASHLDSVNHALLTRKDIIAFANERNLSGIRVPEDGESIVV